MTAITVRDNTGEVLRVPLFGQTNKIAFIDQDQNIILENNPTDNGKDLASYMVSRGTHRVVTGHMSRNAWEVLHAAGVRVYYSELRRMQDILEALRSGELIEINESNSAQYLRKPRGRNQGKRELQH